jgi:hypothetical protein
LFIRTAKADARGRELGDEFIVFRGSKLGPVHQSLVGSLGALRASLLAEGKITLADGDSFMLLQDRTFQSPSYAAAFVLGQSANGRAAWKNHSGVTLKALADAATAGS